MFDSMVRGKISRGTTKCRQSTYLVDTVSTVQVISIALKALYCVHLHYRNGLFGFVSRSHLIPGSKMTKFFTLALIVASAITPGLSGNALARSLPPATQPETPDNRVAQTGVASYYSPVYQGRRAADGSRFDQMALTAAHQSLPFGTKVRVTLAGTDRSVVVTITDRLYSSRRIVDLSLAAARRIGIIHSGLGQVTLRPA